MAVFLANSGGAWDNAKKFVEDGALRRQGLGGPRGDGHRRHRRRPVQGHRRPGDQPADQGDEPGLAADRAGGRVAVARRATPRCASAISLVAVVVVGRRRVGRSPSAAAIAVGEVPVRGGRSPDRRVTRLEPPRRRGHDAAVAERRAGSHRLRDAPARRRLHRRRRRRTLLGPGRTRRWPAARRCPALRATDRRVAAGDADPAVRAAGRPVTAADAAPRARRRRHRSSRTAAARRRRHGPPTGGDPVGAAAGHPARTPADDGDLVVVSDLGTGLGGGTGPRPPRPRAGRRRRVDDAGPAHAARAGRARARRRHRLRRPGAAPARHSGHVVATDTQPAGAGAGRADRGAVRRRARAARRATCSSRWPASGSTSSSPTRRSSSRPRRRATPTATRGLPGDELVRRPGPRGRRPPRRPAGSASCSPTGCTCAAQDWRERVAGWLPADGVDALVVQREVLDPAEYVATWLRDGGEDPAHPDYAAARTTTWLDGFERAGVEAVGLRLGHAARRRGATRPRTRSRTCATRSSQPVAAAPRRQVARPGDRLAPTRRPARPAGRARCGCRPDVARTARVAPGADGPWSRASLAAPGSAACAGAVRVDALGVAVLVGRATADARSGQSWRGARPSDGPADRVRRLLARCVLCWRRGSCWPEPPGDLSTRAR